jgi:hypothetical protein
MQITFESKWISRFSLVILITISLLSTSCKNLFAELAKPEADAAVFYAAKRYADARNYDAAIDKIYELSDEYYARRDVQVFLASMFAGKCGLDFLGLAQSVIDNPGNSTPMELALAHMKDAVDETDCETAEDLMIAVSPNGDGIMSDSVDDAVYMAFIGLAKVGAVLARVADADDDGAADGGYDGCAMTDADTRKIGTGITLLYNNIATTSGSFAAKMGAMNTVCSVSPATCAKTDGSTFTAPELVLIRGVVDYDQFGVGADASYPACP